jgi:hypothetical protein
MQKHRKKQINRHHAKGGQKTKNIDAVYSFLCGYFLFF